MPYGVYPFTGTVLEKHLATDLENDVMANDVYDNAGSVPFEKSKAEKEELATS